VVGTVKLERIIERFRHRWEDRIKLELEKLDKIDECGPDLCGDER
jgi:hypothetical protein